MIDAHGTLHGGGRGRPQQQAADVLRGAVVLGVAALDAFVMDVFIEAIPPLVKQGRLGNEAHTLVDSKGLLHAVGAADPPGELARLASLQYARTTFQRSSAIESHLRRFLGFTPDWTQVASRLKSASADDAKKQLDGFVERRNQIAHAGDVPPGTTKASAISRPYVERCLRTVKVTAEVIDSGLDAYI
ncbi:hypothetical protein GCM10023349_42850 [Nocardioides conyzicola]|uniref:RiboL-PSP-HEPN domain-containing protein n=1 Tax=Nocardioides conyzicola TaxID=1651781 RepID=A0ABP8Y0R3_9ACTN